MGPSFHLLLVSFLLALAAFHGAHTTEKVEFIVASVAEHTQGGKIFIEKMGFQKVKELMSSITTEIWGSVFLQNVDVWEKVHKITLSIDQELNVESCNRELRDHPYDYEIHLSAKHIESYSHNAYEEIRMLLTYEIAQVLEYTGGGQIPVALMNGIGAYVVIKLGRLPARWAKCGDGDIWDQSSDVTGQFLYDCSKTYDDFVEKLNEKMKTIYEKEYFKDITGKTLDELWKEYKAKDRNSMTEKNV